MNHCGTDIVDKLLSNQFLAVIDRVENFPNGKWRYGVLANQAKTFLQFGRNRVLQPEKVIRLQKLASPSRFDGGKSMVCVVQKVNFLTELAAQARKELRYKIEIELSAPLIFWRRVGLRWFVVHRTLAHSIRALQPWDATLRANRFVPEPDVASHGLDGVLDVHSACMS